jgi:Fe-S-cluster containining protein
MNPELQTLYREIPDTTCARSGNCCTLWARAARVEIEPILETLRTEWTDEQRNALMTSLRVQFAARTTGSEPQFSRTTCALYDTTNARCSVYDQRPLACRLFGFGNECPDVRTRDGEHASRAVSDTRRVAWVEALRRLNHSWTDPESGRTISRERFMPIEFWLLLEELGWDDQFDPDSEQFLGRSFGV